MTTTLDRIRAWSQRRTLWVQVGDLDVEVSLAGRGTSDRRTTQGHSRVYGAWHHPAYFESQPDTRQFILDLVYNLTLGTGPKRAAYRTRDRFNGRTPERSFILGGTLRWDGEPVDLYIEAVR